MRSYEHPLATPVHRFASFVLDIVLFILTFAIGWIVWTLIAWRYGQTPAKQILKIKVYDKTSNKVSNWGQMAIRQIFYPVVILFTISSIAVLLEIFIGNEHYLILFMTPSNSLTDFLYTNSIWQEPLHIIWFLLNASWIFIGRKHNRIIDLLCKTDVLNVSRYL